MRRVIETLVGFAVLTGVVVGITTLTPAELPRVTTVEAIRSTKVVCVVIDLDAAPEPGADVGGALTLVPALVALGAGLAGARRLAYSNYLFQ